MTCRNCWDPAPEGQELCEWCAMTPAEQERDATRSGILLGIVLGGLVFLVVWLSR